MNARALPGEVFVDPAAPAVGGSEAALPGAAAQALLDAVTTISSDLDLATVLTRTVDAATELTGARYAGLGVLGPDGCDPVDLVITGGDAGRFRVDARTDPEDPDAATSLVVPIAIRGTAFGNLYLTDKAGGEPFTAQDELLVRGLATAAAFVIENARVYGRSERRRRWLEASADLADALQPPVTVEEAVRLLARSVRTLSGASAVSVVGGDAAPVAVATGADAERLGDAVDLVAGAADSAGDEPTLLHLGGREALAVPLRAHLAGRRLLVALFDRDQALPDVEDRELLAAFADQAALALDRLTALADRAELAVVSDRERIARDLHDTVIQRLFATGLQLQATAMVSGSPQVAGLLERAVSELDLTIRDIRGTIFELRHGPAEPPER